MQGNWKINITDRALRELHEIHSHIAVDSLPNANGFLLKLLESIDGLATLPLRTIVQKTSKEWNAPIRALPVEAYIIYFVVFDDPREVRVLSIRHTARRRPRF